MDREATQYTDKDGDTWTRQPGGHWELTAASGAGRDHVIGVRFESLAQLRRVHGPLTPVPAGGTLSPTAPLTRSEFRAFLVELAMEAAADGVRQVVDRALFRMGDAPQDRPEPSIRATATRTARYSTGDSPARVAAGTRVRVDFARYAEHTHGKTGTVTANDQTTTYGIPGSDSRRLHPYAVKLNDGDTVNAAEVTPLSEDASKINPPRTLAEHATAISIALADAAADGFYLDDARGTWLDEVELNTVTRHGQPGANASVTLPAIKLPKGA